MMEMNNKDPEFQEKINMIIDAFFFMNQTVKNIEEKICEFEVKIKKYAQLNTSKKFSLNERIKIRSILEKNPKMRVNFLQDIKNIL